MRGLMPQQPQPAAAAAAAPPAGSSPAGDSQQGVPATQEEQQAYDRFVDNAQALIYDEKTIPVLLDSVKRDADPNLEAEPALGLANAAAMIVMRLEDSARQAGQEIPESVLLHGGIAVIADISILAKEAGVKEYQPQELQAAMGQAVEIYQNVRAGGDGEESQGLMRDGARGLAEQGTNGDTEVGHLTEGEVVVPNEAQDEETEAVLKRKLGEKLERFRVGGEDDRVNPKTGLKAFYGDSNDPGGEPGAGVGGSDAAGPSGSSGPSGPGPGGGKGKGKGKGKGRGRAGAVGKAGVTGGFGPAVGGQQTEGNISNTTAGMGKSGQPVAGHVPDEGNIGRPGVVASITGPMPGLPDEAAQLAEDNFTEQMAVVDAFVGSMISQIPGAMAARSIAGRLGKPDAESIAEEDEGQRANRAGRRSTGGLLGGRRTARGRK